MAGWGPDQNVPPPIETPSLTGRKSPGIAGNSQPPKKLHLRRWATAGLFNNRKDRGYRPSLSLGFGKGGSMALPGRRNFLVAARSAYAMPHQITE